MRHTEIEAWALAVCDLAIELNQPRCDQVSERHLILARRQLTWLGDQYHDNERCRHCRPGSSRPATPTSHSQTLS
jgi:hypothetical protein